MGPPAHGAELHITAHHPYLSIYLCLCFRRALSLCKFGVGTAPVGLGEWGVSGLGHRLISDGSH